MQANCPTLGPSRWELRYRYAQVRLTVLLRAEIQCDPLADGQAKEHQDIGVVACGNDDCKLFLNDNTGYQRATT